MVTMSSTFADLYVHLVWTTFRRSPWISEHLEKPLYAAMAEKCRELRCPPLAIGGVAGHVHLLVALSPSIAIAKLVKEVKGSSAHLVTHRLSPDTAFQWQGGYGAFTLRKDDAPAVRRYILHQKTHHDKKTIALEWEPFDAADVHEQ